MLFFKQILLQLKRHPEIASVLIVLFLGILAGASLLQPGYFNMHDDLQMMRQLAMEECFKDGQIPCRWTPHMGYGFGFPLFNYYPPLPYLIGQIFRVVGFSFVDTVKYTAVLSFIASGVTMYVLARQFWGRLGGLVSSAFYIWAPYHAVDVYVRGAMNEAWALVWFPLILWSSYKLIKEAQFRWIIALTLSWFALFTSHNLMVLIFTPLFGAWVLFWIWREKSWFTIPQLMAAGAWALGLAAFFTLPVILEKDLVHTETLVQGYYEYVAHFVSLNQLLISRFWGYGPSVWETKDDRMSFQLGHLHWIVSLVVLVLVIWRYKKTRKFDNILFLAVFFVAAGWFAAFMAHTRSIKIWQAIESLQFVQFPWRFVTLSIFSFSIVTGALIKIIEGRKPEIAKWIAVLAVAGIVFLGKDYFRPEKMGPITDKEKFSGAAWELQQTAGIYDYLPKSAKEAPKGPQETIADIVEGKGEITDGKQGTNWAEFKVSAVTDALVRINIFQFPGWKVFVDGKEVLTGINNDSLGRMYITVPGGEHKISANLFDTAPRRVGNLISLVSWLALLTAPIWRRR